jgi:uroporphyrin-III C-methyltransferase / precorrin-2 dehydrogenase / sirohydrochlorin ferrochelatase
VRHLPLFFDLAGRRVVVVGSGAMADRRAALARSAGADVRRFETIGRNDIQGAAVVLVATDGEASDIAAQRVAKAAGVPVNVADRPALSDFILPAIVDRDEVVVAISTGGASPSLATLLRAKIEALLPERVGRLARFAKTFRAQAKVLIVDPGARRVFWRRLLDGPAAGLTLIGDDAGARRVALVELDDARRLLKSVGIAHIVGSGPGDPDLLTLRAARLLHEADAVLHDELVPSAILGRARREAEFIAVGKRKGRPGWPQAAIEAEMIRRVRAGQTVVRLKAGDPFVFGRGGEELEALRAAGLPVSVVPGVTAALGCAASAGIPLTHRRIASGLTIMSGHTAQESGGGRTYAIYMGAGEAVSVRDRLLADGVDAGTPVAIIENGTRPDERISSGRLGDLPRLAASHLGGGPSLIVVGEVAALARINELSLLAEAS